MHTPTHLARDYEPHGCGRERITPSLRQIPGQAHGRIPLRQELVAHLARITTRLAERLLLTDTVKRAVGIDEGRTRHFRYAIRNEYLHCLRIAPRARSRPARRQFSQSSNPFLNGIDSYSGVRTLCVRFTTAVLFIVAAFIALRTLGGEKTR